MKSDYEKLSEYRWGIADEETRREVEGELARPGSSLAALLDRMNSASRAWFPVRSRDGPTTGVNPRTTDASTGRAGDALDWLVGLARGLAEGTGTLGAERDRVIAALERYRRGVRAGRSPGLAGVRNPWWVLLRLASPAPAAPGDATVSASARGDTLPDRAFVPDDVETARRLVIELRRCLHMIDGWDDPLTVRIATLAMELYDADAIAAVVGEPADFIDAGLREIADRWARPDPTAAGVGHGE
jgi:hypothetical protein